MLRIALILPHVNQRSDDTAFTRQWQVSQFERLATEPEGWWIETFHHGDYGQTIALVGLPQRLKSLLRHEHDELACAAPEALAVVYLDWLWLETQLQQFAADFSLSPAISRAVLMLFQTGNVRKTAEAAGISYETAREHLDSARALLGAANLQRLVTFIGLGIGRTGESAEESDQLLGLAFDVSQRQMRIAGMIANGATRRETAGSLGISDALVKKELSVVYSALGVTNAITLARAMVELRLLAIAAHRGDGEQRLPPAAHRVLHRPARDGRTIAASDYGPRTGHPVLVLHSSMTSRPANRALVEALQDQGFRPVAIDRPGFGDTDPAPPDCVGEAFFDLAARDIIDFCTAMGWPRIFLVSRGAAQVVVALHRAQPDLTEAAIVMNPDPDAGSSSRQTGFLAVMKKNFVRRPWAVGLMTRWIAQSLTYARVRDHVLRSTADCPVDRRIMERPQHMADYYRGLAAFRRGCLDGFCREQAALATMGKPDPIPGTPHLTLLVGEYDSIHDPHETLHYWRDVLPDAQVLFEPGSGRFMSYSHAQTVAKRLSAR